MKTQKTRMTIQELEDLAAAMRRDGREEAPLGDGLYLRARRTPVFEAHYRWPKPDGTSGRRRFSIGSIYAHEIEDSRMVAIEVLRRAKAGIDPEEAQVDIPTFGEHATAFMARHLVDAKNKNTAAKWRSSLTNHCQPIWNVKVNEIDRARVLSVLEPIWTTIPSMADEVRSRIAMILGDAENRGFRNVHDHGINPAEWNRALQHTLGKQPKRGSIRGAMASVPFEELPALIAELDLKKIATARALIAIAMTCVRTQEFLGMRMGELKLDAEQPTWTIPYQRFKVDPHKKDFVLPLAPQVVRVLKEQIAELETIVGKGKVDYLWLSLFKFKGGRAPETPYMSNATMLVYLKRGMGVKATVHGFRASFRTWADDQSFESSDAVLKYNHAAVEFCLAHVPGSAAEQAYQRGMMLRARVAIMRDWANYLMPPEAADNVLPFKREQVR